MENNKNINKNVLPGKEKKSSSVNLKDGQSQSNNQSTMDYLNKEIGKIDILDDKSLGDALKEQIMAYDKRINKLEFELKVLKETKAGEVEIQALEKKIETQKRKKDLVKERYSSSRYRAASKIGNFNRAQETADLNLTNDGSKTKIKLENEKIKDNETIIRNHIQGVAPISNRKANKAQKQINKSQKKIKHQERIIEKNNTKIAKNMKRENRSLKIESMVNKQVEKIPGVKPYKKARSKLISVVQNVERSINIPVQRMGYGIRKAATKAGLALGHVITAIFQFLVSNPVGWFIIAALTAISAIVVLFMSIPDPDPNIIATIVNKDKAFSYQEAWNLAYDEYKEDEFYKEYIVTIPSSYLSTVTAAYGDHKKIQEYLDNEYLSASDDEESLEIAKRALNKYIEDNINVYEMKTMFLDKLTYIRTYLIREWSSWQRVDTLEEAQKHHEYKKIEKTCIKKVPVEIKEDYNNIVGQDCKWVKVCKAGKCKFEKQCKPIYESGTNTRVEYVNEEYDCSYYEVRDIIATSWTTNPNDPKLENMHNHRKDGIVLNVDLPEYRPEDEGGRKGIIQELPDGRVEKVVDYWLAKKILVGEHVYQGTKDQAANYEQSNAHKEGVAHMMAFDWYPKNINDTRRERDLYDENGKFIKKVSFDLKQVYAEYYSDESIQENWFRDHDDKYEFEIQLEMYYQLFNGFFMDNGVIVGGNAEIEIDKYSKYYSEGPFGIGTGLVGQCTWWSWGRASEVNDRPLPVIRGNAGDWFYNAHAAGYQTGISPKPNSWAIYAGYSSAYGYAGHVRYVEAITEENGDYMITWSGGQETQNVPYPNDDLEVGFTPVSSGKTKRSEFENGSSRLEFIGYIYID